MDYKIFCNTFGDPWRASFSVTISREETVDDLKKLIKNQKPIGFANIDASDLVLWKCSLSKKTFPDLKTIDDLGKLGGKELSPIDKIKNFVTTSPVEDCVHIFIVLPSKSKLFFYFFLKKNNKLYIH